MHFGLQWHGVDPTAVVRLSVLFQIQKIHKELTKNLQKDYKLPKNLKVQMKIVTYLSRSDILGGHKLTDLQYILPFDLKVIELRPNRQIYTSNINLLLIVGVQRLS